MVFGVGHSFSRTALLLADKNQADVKKELRRAEKRVTELDKPVLGGKRSLTGRPQDIQL